MAREWVSVNKDIKVYGSRIKNGERVPFELGVVKAGSVGFITNEVAEEGTVYVRFPEFYSRFREDELVAVTPYELDTAIDIIKGFEGHHASDGEFQFNIKFYSWECSPKADHYLTSEELDIARWDILDHELRCSFDTSYCDGSFAEDLGWVDGFNTAGRIGGWLVLSHLHGYSSESIEESLRLLEEEKEELLQRWDQLEGPDEDMEREFEEELNYINEQVFDLMTEANDLARDLELTKYYIKEAKENLAEYMKTEDCWEMYYEDKVIEEQKQLQYEKDVVEGLKAWRTVRNYLEDSYFEQDTGIEVISKIDKILPTPVK